MPSTQYRIVKWASLSLWRLLGGCPGAGRGVANSLVALDGFVVNYLPLGRSCLPGVDVIPQELWAFFHGIPGQGDRGLRVSESLNLSWRRQGH